MKTTYTIPFNQINIKDINKVGGKNASLGEMLSQLGSLVLVPDGFATTAEAYRYFLEQNQIENHILSELELLKKNKQSIQITGKNIRSMILHAKTPETLRKDILTSYYELGKKYKTSDLSVAVRSSATAEDLPDASFAGQQETYLNISGESDLLFSVRSCYAPLFTDRAISYRIAKGFEHSKVALSVGIQKMVRSDLAGSGVMFSIDTETGFPDVVVISAAWGLGENVVQGEVTPDEYRVYKPFLNNEKLIPILQKTVGAKEKKMVYYSGKTHQTTKNIATSKKEQNSFVLSDKEILTLSKWASIIESHYKKPMDMEWAKDKDGKLYIVQARPETVQSRKKQNLFKSWKLLQKGKQLCQGLAIGEGIVVAQAQVIKSVRDMDKFKPGSILVTEITDPDWGPIMKQASGIITDHGGRTSHAAIISRELGIPAIVGCIDATTSIPNGKTITLSCTEEKGNVYAGKLNYSEKNLNISSLPKVKTTIKLNLASPEAAFKWWKLPVKGIGLARMEFIINDIIRFHPMALIHPEQVKDKNDLKQIQELTIAYKNPQEYFIQILSSGIAKLAASQYPHPVLVRFSDFKTNEYAKLLGGMAFEPNEENPMLGFRGASRYYSKEYSEAFALECKAIKRAREVIGMDNIQVMIPFCRTLEEADLVLKQMAKNGLKRNDKKLKIFMMCEIPANVILGEEFAEKFDGFSIGSNDLTQLTLGVDRDSGKLAALFDERNEAVKRMISDVIKKAHKKGIEIGICGQAPSDYPDFARFLVKEGIDSISLNPDSVIETIKKLGNDKSL